MGPGKRIFKRKLTILKVKLHVSLHYRCLFHNDLLIPRRFCSFTGNQAISHALLDLLISQTQNPSANTTPNTPSSPSPHVSRGAHHVTVPPSYTSDQLMRLKIAMRETEHPPRSRTPILGDGYHDLPDGADAIGRNEGTVRFLFGPHGGA